MIPWLTQLCERLTQGETAILITVAEVKGSAPREVGARMIIDVGSSFGTIGGGELEWQAAVTARALLASGAQGQVMRKSLGPDLGQCCGGQVTLALEPFAPSDLAWVQALYAQAMTAQGAGRRLSISANGTVKRDMIDAPQAGHLVRAAASEVSLVEKIAPDLQPLWLFGAGHVGRAVVQALAPLPFAITWIDSREGAFAADEPLGSGSANNLVLAMPELSVDEAPEATFYLVMTHSHSLDEEIVSAVLQRGDAAYLGLIGSDTKRARFFSRLKARGHGATAISSLHCPIGLPGPGGKSPAIIAASVAADFCQRHYSLSAMFASQERMDLPHVQ